MTWASSGGTSARISPKRPRCLLAVGHQLLDQAAVGERRPAGQKEVECAAEAVDVGPDVGGVRVVDLLGGDVVGRAQDHPLGGHPGVGADLAGEPGQAEVEDLDLAAGRPHQVLRLDVAVDHAVLEGVLEPQRRLAGVLARLADRQRPAAIDQPAQVGPLDELHDQHVRLPGLLGVVGGHDVRVRGQPRGRLDLAAESLDHGRVAQQIAADDLQGDRPVHQPMLGAVDGAHAAGAEGGDDPVRAGGRSAPWGARRRSVGRGPARRRSSGRGGRPRRRGRRRTTTGPGSPMAARSRTRPPCVRRDRAAPRGESFADQRVLRLVADPLATRVAGGQVLLDLVHLRRRRAGPGHRPPGGWQ